MHSSRQLYLDLVEAHAPGLYCFAYRLTGSADRAEDLLQESFLQAWRSLDRLREPARARAWLLAILRHCHAHRRRAQARRPASSWTGPELDALAAPAGPDARDDADLLQAGLDRLDERFKLPFLMVYLEGHSCRETAEALGLPLGTVLSRIHRARLHLRESLPRLAGEGPHTMPRAEAREAP